MAVSKAQQKATTKYKKANYGEIKLLISPKEKKADLQAHAAANGESLNGFVNRAIDEAVKRDTITTQQTAQDETQQSDRLILDMLGYDPLAEMDLYKEERTKKQYFVRPLNQEPDIGEWDENKELPF